MLLEGLPSNIHRAGVGKKFKTLSVHRCVIEKVIKWFNTHSVQRRRTEAIKTLLLPSKQQQISSTKQTHREKNDECHLIIEQ